MRVLIIKTSSMGDVLHTLPALTDAMHALPDVRFDWVVEEAFRRIPEWHPAVENVVPVAMRRWRKRSEDWFGREVRDRLGQLREHDYAHVIDAQGLLKSAMIARLAKGAAYHGFSFASARESPSAMVYTHRSAVPLGLHAIKRNRLLFAESLGYSCGEDDIDYGIDTTRFQRASVAGSRSLVFIHGATWSSKLWPESHWHELIELANEDGYEVLLPWGNESEHLQATRLCESHGNARLLPELGLDELATTLGAACGAVAVDTGPGHLAAALSTPCVSIYGATDAELTGTYGLHQIHLRAEFECSPCLAKRCAYRGTSAVEPACYATVSPPLVWGKLRPILKTGNVSVE